LEPEEETSSRARNSLSPLALLGILVSWVALVSIRRPPRKPDENRGKADYPVDTTTNPDDSAPRQLTTVAQVPPAPPQNDNADRRKNDAPLWEKLAATAVAIGTLGLLVVNIFLWSSTKKAADAAMDAAIAAKKAQKFSETSLRVQVRPYLSAVSMRGSGSVIPGKNVIGIVLRNSGRTPALKVSFESAQVSIGVAEAINKSISIIPSESNGGETPIRFTLTEREIGQIKGGKRFTVNAVVRYADVFKDSLKTTICAFYDPKDGQYYYCEEDNDIE
jgi:hypothetical protein